MIQRRLTWRKKAIQLVLLMVLAPLAYGVLLFWQPLWLFHRSEWRDGNVIVKQVELFRETQGRLPNSLEDMKLKGLSDQVFYHKTDVNHYEVWFSIDLGESEVYDSFTKQWR